MGSRGHAKQSSDASWPAPCDMGSIRQGSDATKPSSEDAKQGSDAAWSFSFVPKQSSDTTRTSSEDATSADATKALQRGRYQVRCHECRRRQDATCPFPKQSSDTTRPSSEVATSVDAKQSSNTNWPFSVGASPVAQ